MVREAPGVELVALVEQPRLKFVERAATLQALRAAVETGEIPRLQPLTT